MIDPDILAIRRRRRQEGRYALLPELIRLYRQGRALPAIGAALGLSRNRVERLIRSARERGEWPEGLRRKQVK